MKLVVKGPNGIEIDVAVDLECLNLAEDDFAGKKLIEEVMVAVNWMYYKIDLEKEIKERSEY